MFGMKIRFRKSVKVIPGVRVNATQRGLRSLSLGPHRRAPWNTATRRFTVNLPGPFSAVSTPASRRATHQTRSGRQAARERRRTVRRATVPFWVRLLLALTILAALAAVVI
jgi:hypothetical protein